MNVHSSRITANTSPTIQTPVTHRRVFAIAVPAMAANLTTPLLGLVAIAAIGRLGDATALGGVAMASAAYSFMFWLFGFLRMSTIGFTAQAIGAGDTVEVRAIFCRALLLATCLGGSLILLQWPIATLLFRLLGGTPEVTAAATLYFKIRIWSSPFLLANYVVLGWLIGQARTGRALAIQIAVNIVSMVGTFILVPILGWGIMGAAIAPVIAEVAGLVLGLSIVSRVAGGSLAVPRTVLLQRAQFIRLMNVNRDIIIRTFALVSAFLFFTAQGARTGDVALATNAVLYNMVSFGTFFMEGLTAAGSQLSGQTFGARDRKGFVRTAQITLFWNAQFAVGLALTFFFGGALFIDLITTNPDVRLAARDILWLATLAPICGFTAYTFDAVYIGATWARDMRNLMLLSLGLYLGVWVMLRPLGNEGLWMAFLSFLLVRGLLQGLRYPQLLRNAFDTKTSHPEQDKFETRSNGA